MNEKVKMSDTFYLPLDFTDNGDKGGALIENGIPVFMRGCKYKAKYAAIAINSYDQHVELIAKQAEQLKIMRDCIAEIRNGGLLLSEIESMCDKVINPTKLVIDKLTQAEQIKMLRDALQLVDGNDDKLNQAWFDCGYHKAVDAALSATEQK